MIKISHADMITSYLVICQRFLTRKLGLIYKPGFERLMTMKSFGERARARREKLKLSQEKVGEECKVSQEAIRQMEAGMLQRVPRYIDNLVKTLETNKEWLLSGTGPVENIVNDQPSSMPGVIIAHAYTCADLEKAYKSATLIERAKFDAMYPVLQKEMQEVTEETTTKKTSSIKVGV